MRALGRREVAGIAVIVLGAGGVAGHEAGVYGLPDSAEMEAIDFGLHTDMFHDIGVAFRPGDASDSSETDTPAPYSQLLATCSATMISETYAGVEAPRFATNPDLAICGSEQAISRANEMNDNLDSELFKKSCAGHTNGEGVFMPGCLGYCAHLAEATHDHFDAPYGSATAMYEGMQAAGKMHFDRQPPIGAYVFYDNGGPHGHVAIYIGGDKVFTSDIRNENGEGRANIVYSAEMEDGFGLIYLGWSEVREELRAVSRPVQEQPAEIVVVAAIEPGERRIPFVVALINDRGIPEIRERQFDEVVEMQNDLNAIHCDPLAVNGIFDGTTGLRVATFQRNTGLKDDQIAGIKTQTKLNEAIAAGNQACGA